MKIEECRARNQPWPEAVPDVVRLPVLNSVFEHDVCEHGRIRLVEFGLHRAPDDAAVMIGETSA
nr:hypothetical protein OG781_33690 [Streptomyces sp. NBC_00830]